MRHFRFTVSMLKIIALVLAAAPSMTFASEEAASPAPSEIHSIDPSKRAADLLSAIKRERDADKADVSAKELMALWEDFQSPTINTLMQRAKAAADVKNFAEALDYFDQVIVLEPEFAQAYYRRAYVHYADGNTAKAIADLYKTLELNPQHFGAMFELARIFSNTGHEKSAVAALDRFLTIYPAYKEARDMYRDLTEKLAGTRS